MLDSAIKRFRLGVYCPRYHDATSLYRAMGPFTAMEHQDPRLEIMLPFFGNEGQELSWAWYNRCDAIFVQRPWLPDHLRIIVQAKMCGKPVWVDYDDDYPSVHPSNPTYHVFVNSAPALDKVIQMCDVASFSTRELEERRTKHIAPIADGGKRGFIIPNSLHFEMQPLEKPRTRRVCWRGGGSHEYDLLQVLPTLLDVAKMPAFRRWQFAFLGECPWQVPYAFPKEQLLLDSGAEPHLYMEIMGALLPWVNIVPLAEHPFNTAKSNIAWIESAMCGAVTLAPDWLEWQRPGVIHYKDKETFKDRLVGIMAGFAEHTCHPKVLESRDYIESNLRLETVNVLRWEILNNLYALAHP